MVCIVFKIGRNESNGVMRGAMAISGEMYTKNDISCVIASASLERYQFKGWLILAGSPLPTGDCDMFQPIS